MIFADRIVGEHEGRSGYDQCTVVGVLVVFSRDIALRIEILGRVAWRRPRKDPEGGQAWYKGFLKTSEGAVKWTGALASSEVIF